MDVPYEISTDTHFKIHCDYVFKCVSRVVCLTCVSCCCHQVSQVYQTIEFERLAALAPFVNNFHLERVIVNVAKQLRLQVSEIC